MSIAEKLIAIAENEKKVYDAGKEAGKNAEYDRFWDDYQQNGNRENCRAMFSGAGWDVNTFKPKHRMKPSTNKAVFMFQFFNSENAEMIDYRNFKHLFDFSEITNGYGLFQDARMDYIDIDLSSATTILSCFSETYFPHQKTHITLKTSDKCTNYSSAFATCSALTDLFFAEGSVIATTIDLKSCPLIKASMTSVINALSSTTSGQTCTFKKTAKEAAFTEDEWDELIGTKPNWTFSLV